MEYITEDQGIKLETLKEGNNKSFPQIGDMVQGFSLI